MTGCGGVMKRFTRKLVRDAIEAFVVQVVVTAAEEGVKLAASRVGRRHDGD